MNQIGINTSQNVNILFTLAGVGERLVAFIIDMVIKILYLLVGWWIVFDVLGFGRYFESMDPWSYRAIMGVFFLPFVFYTLFFELLMEGQTIGKRIMKIKVVKIDGYQAGFADYAMRWFFRLIDIVSNVGVVGLLSIIISDKNQRLGDIVAGSAVISLKNKINISHTILEELKEDYIPTFPQVFLLNDNDVRIIKENYIVACRNHDKQLITKLSNKIKATLKLEVDPTKLTNRQFIDLVIKDYNYYTSNN